MAIATAAAPVNERNFDMSRESMRLTISLATSALLTMSGISAQATDPSANEARADNHRQQMQPATPDAASSDLADATSNDSQVRVNDARIKPQFEQRACRTSSR
jgi:hypothetical protein